MVEKLRKKPGGDTLAVTMGDFATVAVDGRFGLVVLAYTTFLELASQELQIECFHNAKSHLERRVAGGISPPGSHRTDYVEIDITGCMSSGWLC